jgi:ATP-binding cassette, subfamily B, multidrug efflux pump
MGWGGGRGGFGGGMGMGRGMGGGMGGGGFGAVPLGGRGGDGWDYEELGKIYDFGLLRRMWPYARPYHRRLAAALVAMLGSAIMEYSQPFIIGLGVSAALRGDTDQVAIFGVVLFFFAIGAGVLRAAKQLLMAWVAQRLLYHLRNEAFSHLQRLSLGFYDREEVGRLMSRVTSDVNQMQQIMSTGLLNVVQDAAGLVILSALMLATDLILGLAVLVVAPVVVAIMAVWQRYAQRAFIRTRVAISLVNSNINQNVSGVRVVQSLRREDHNLREFDRLNRNNFDANVQAGFLQAVIMPAVEIMSTVAMMLVVVALGWQLFTERIPAAEAAGYAIAFTLAIQRFFTPIRMLVMQYATLQRAMAGAHRVFELLDVRPDIVDAPDAVELPRIEGRVDFDHVWFAYRGEQWVLRDFDLHVQPGETIAFVGHTGAGKTSVTALLARFYDIQRGQILIDGHDIKQVTVDSLRRQMSVVLQEPYLFSGTVAENIRYGRLDATDDEVRRAAQAVGADQFIDRLPQGYHTPIHERGVNLSTGQRQLVAFARAVVADPRIIVLDEATANIDTKTEKVIQQALERMTSGRTSFVIAHRLSTIRNADRIVVLDRGEIVEVGTHDDLLDRNGHYADLYRMSFSQMTAEEAASELSHG